MTLRTFSLPSPRLVLGSLLLAAGVQAFAAEAGVSTFAGRGVFPFPSTVSCPFGAPAAGAAACERVALDDADTRATLDAAAHVIRFANDRAYDRKTVVGDVLLQGSGRTADGRRVPLNFHLVLSKSGGRWSVNSHAHAPVRGNFDDVQVDAWRIEAGDPAQGGVALAPAAIRATLAKPGVMARVARQFVDVVDNRTAAAPDPDVTIRVGLGPAGLSVMRASLHADAPGPDGLDAMLRQGTWALTLRPLSNKIPGDVARRELFLYGLDTQPTLKPLVDRGFESGEPLVVGAEAGKGYLSLGDRRQDFPEAAQAGLVFMQQSFVGLVLGWEQANAAPGAH